LTFIWTAQIEKQKIKPTIMIGRSTSLAMILCICAILTLPLTTALSSNNVPRHRVYSLDESPISCVTEKAKGWVVASILGATLMLGPGVDPAMAASGDRTKIELDVETDYLVRVLEYFDGDMKRALGAIVRSPFSNVRIDPPEASRDAILRALYSYNSPDDYTTQASWLSIQPKKSLVDDLLEKKYSITIPSMSGGAVNTRISFSNLEIGLILALLSYPVTYALYQFESYQEEQQAIAKRAAAAAKKAGSSKKTAAAKKKETPTPEPIPPGAEKRSKGPRGAGGENKEEPSFVKESTPDTPTVAATVTPSEEPSPGSAEASSKSFSASKSYLDSL
jgi:hypothetical protein